MNERDTEALIALAERRLAAARRRLTLIETAIKAGHLPVLTGETAR